MSRQPRRIPKKHSSIKAKPDGWVPPICYKKVSVRSHLIGHFLFSFSSPCLPRYTVSHGSSEYRFLLQSDKNPHLPPTVSTPFYISHQSLFSFIRLSSVYTNVLFSMLGFMFHSCDHMRNKHKNISYIYTFCINVTVKSKIVRIRVRGVDAYIWKR